MTKALCFWLLMLLLVFFGSGLSAKVGLARPALGGWLITLALFALLGWEVFGPAVR